MAEPEKLVQEERPSADGEYFGLAVRTLNGRVVCVEGLQGSQTLASLRAKVHAALAEGGGRVAVRLFAGGELLPDDAGPATLGAHGIGAGSELTAVLEVPALTRVLGWTVRTLPARMTGAGNVVTIQRGNARRLGWWASYDGVFSRRGTSPFPPRRQAPALAVSFAEPVALQAVGVVARNLPRSVQLLADGAAEGPVLEFRSIEPSDSQAWAAAPVWSEAYAQLLREEMPQGQPASAKAYERHPHLPTALPEPLSCTTLELRLLSSHEPGWVGINDLAFYA